jgi:hypothetical protein
MKRFGLIALVASSAIWLSGCRKDPKDIPQKPIQTPIGKGVEIYRAKLEWTPFNRTVRLKSATIKGDTPVIRYDQIIYYFKEKLPNFYAQVGFELTKPVSNSSGFYTFGRPALSYASAPDTGFCVTVDRELIFAGALGDSYTLYGSDLIFRRHHSTREYAVMIYRDTLYTVNAQNIFQTAPDPRHDPRLLDRLRRDGKLKF